jgi:glycosyltransferase involved in cell wall biosynthesis
MAIFGLGARPAAGRRHWNTDRVPTIGIVTPVLNGMPFIDETIMSIVAQAGPFMIRYHVQDAGSTDGTQERLKYWKTVLERDFPVLCAGVKFSYASEPDAGLYDGIAKGFTAIGATDHMSWINADDRYEQGAFASVSEIFAKFDDVRWVGGRPVIMSEAGCPGELVGIRGFPRPAIAARIFEGRFSPFFMQQEGIFWQRSLWDEVGGLRTLFRLAGDFDLWARFAEHTDFVVADALLGTFRVRTGQLSASIDKYHAEIDAHLGGEAAEARRVEISEAFKAADTPQAMRDAGMTWRVAVNRVFAGGWDLVNCPA